MSVQLTRPTVHRTFQAPVGPNGRAGRVPASSLRSPRSRVRAHRSTWGATPGPRRFGSTAAAPPRSTRRLPTGSTVPCSSRPVAGSRSAGGARRRRLFAGCVAADPLRGCAPPHADGKLWALQTWRRLAHGPVELRFSRWHGSPTALTLHAVCCKWGGENIEGTASFQGRPIYGEHATPQGVPLDDLGRNVYLDSYRGTGWMRMMGILTNRPTGSFRSGSGRTGRAPATGARSSGRTGAGRWRRMPPRRRPRAAAS